MRLGELRDRLGPLERGALAVGEERCLPPGAERVETLLRLAPEACLLGVHVDAVGTAVDLGGPDLDEVEKALVQLRCDFAGEAEHGAAHTGGHVFRKIESWFHGWSPVLFEPSAPKTDSQSLL